MLYLFKYIQVTLTIRANSFPLNIVIDAQPTLPNAPIANAQSFLESNSATISDLQISSSGSPVWYNQAVSGTQYATSFPLVTGNYFAAQVDVSSCESVNRTSVSVTIFPISMGGSVSGTTTVCSGTNSTVNFIWTSRKYYQVGIITSS